MAAKLIRDDLLESERVHKVPVEARWLYATVLLMADDVGLFEVNLFALARKSGIDQDYLQRLLKSLAVVDLIRPYEVDKKPFAFIPRYKQRLQITRAKCPLPPESLLHGDEDAVTKINKIKDLTSNPRKTTENHGKPPPEPEPEPKEEKDLSLRSRSATTPPSGGDGAPPKRKRTRTKAGEDTPSTLVWSAYAGAYLARYGVEPVRNSMVNGQIAQFVTRIPAAEAPAVAAFYVGHRGGLYVSAKHPMNLLLRDAEKLRTDWATNQRADPSKSGETAFAKERRERVASLTGGLASRKVPANNDSLEAIDVVPDATRLLG